MFFAVMAFLAMPLSQTTPFLARAQVIAGPGRTKSKLPATNLRDSIGRIVIPVTINGKGPFRFSLDTASDSSAISESLVRSLGIAVTKNGVVKLHGVTGSALVRSTVAKSMKVGDLVMNDVRLPIVRDVFGGVQGVLGTRGWTEKRIFLDFRNDIASIATSKLEKAPVGFSRIPIKLTKESLIAMDINIGKVPVRAIFDTGSEQTIGNTKLRIALFRMDPKAEGQEIRGVTLDTVRGPNFEIPLVTMDGIQLRNRRVTFGDVSIFQRWDLIDEPALLLGMDIIGLFDTVIIDYKLGEIQLLWRNR